MTTPSPFEIRALNEADKVRKEATAEVTALRRKLEAEGLKPKQIQSDPRLLAAQAKLEEAKSAAGLLTTAQSLEILNKPGVGPKAADARLAAGNTRAREGVFETARQQPGYAQENFTRSVGPGTASQDKPPTVAPPPGYRWRWYNSGRFGSWQLEASKEARERDSVGAVNGPFGGGRIPWEFDSNTNSFIFVPNQWTPEETIGKFQPAAKGGRAEITGSTMRLPTVNNVIDGGGSLGTFSSSSTNTDNDSEYTYDDEFDRQISGAFTNQNVSNSYENFLRQQTELQNQMQQQTARQSLEALLRQFFFDQDASFITDALKAAEPDIISGLPTDTIILKMQDYRNPNSLFSKRFAGNVKLQEKGIEPLSPAEYLQQEARYRDVLSTRGLGELATRNTFADLISGQVSPFELEDRVVKVFDIYDNADAALKSELQGTLRLDPLSTRTSVAKALLLGDKGATELQRQVRTAEVGTEARTRGLDVTSAEELARMGVTREQARAGFEQISLTQPRLGQLSEMYTRETPDATGLQRELEAEQFQGMQSQRRRRLVEQEQASFMGSSGTAGAQSLTRRRAGSI
jgi:hypothetical protein